MGEEFQNAGGNRQTRILQAIEIGLLLQDTEPQFIIGRVKIDDQATLQARLTQSPKTVAAIGQATPKAKALKNGAPLPKITKAAGGKI